MLFKASATRVSVLSFRVPRACWTLGGRGVVLRNQINPAGNRTAPFHTVSLDLKNTVQHGISDSHPDKLEDNR